MTRTQLTTLAIALAAASIALSILFKGLFLVLLIPALLFWNKGRPEDRK